LPPLVATKIALLGDVSMLTKRYAALAVGARVRLHSVRR
jgi:hypothetical protein